jgi:superfamily I DNA/RNA helicase
VLCVAPAGSGKTTTLVARVAWLLGHGHPAARTCVVTFNRRAAEEIVARLTTALAPLSIDADAVRVRTFHALAREILASAGRPVEPIADRAAVLADLLGDRAPPALLRALDDTFSRLKLDAGLDARGVARTMGQSGRAAARGATRRGRTARAFLAYEAALTTRGARDFDDLVRDAVALLESDAGVRALWHERCGHLLVDEVQDVDRSQLRMALLLAAPEHRLFLVGDDDQTIYAWRLADVRRILGLASDLPGLRRVDLVTNYRCPGPVVKRAVRLVEHNRERFSKRILPRPAAAGTLVLAPDSGDDVARARRLLHHWPPFAGSVASHGRAAVLARTNAELVPFAAAALEVGMAFEVEDDGLLLQSVELDRALDSLGVVDGPRALVQALGQAPVGEIEATQATRALLGWAPTATDAAGLRALLERARARRACLRQEGAPLVLATVHGTKGLEFDHVAVVGLDDGRFPSARSLAEAVDPRRTLEEERRLAYVAWTRARRSLVLVYDPGAPSRFMREAFDRRELAAAEAVRDVR